MGFILVNEESKSYGENIMKKLFFNDSFLVLKDNIKDFFLEKCIVKKSI